ncbi:MAG: Alpha-amylase precursor [Alphaproteobacteria bacterium ADurb.Bin438]|nr:MAG: Alpha-amylase precursor [Alphaproteobacteria bacterium ADurb.Bin438]
MASAIACSKQTEGENKGKMTGLVFATGNHDAGRMRNRVLGDNPSDNAVKTLQKLYMSLPGPLCVYNGDELGLPQVKVPEHLRVDPCLNNRDGCRVPIPWDNEKPNMGFCSEDNEPFLPIHLIDQKYAVSAQEKDKNSLLSSYRTFADYRQSNEIMQKGGIELVEVSKKFIAFKRVHEGKEILCAFNLSKDYDYKLNLELYGGKQVQDFKEDLKKNEFDKKDFEVNGNSIKIPPEGCFIVECPKDFKVATRSYLEDLTPEGKLDVVTRPEKIADTEIRIKLEKIKNNYYKNHQPLQNPMYRNRGNGR